MDWRKKVETVIKKEREGIEVESRGFKFRVALVNAEYSKRLNDEMKKLGVSAIKDLPDDLIYSVMIETVLKDWSGFEEDGKEIPFSTEKAIEILLTKTDEGEYLFDQALGKIASTSVNDQLFYKETVIKN